ncbi:hypothetical protein KM176_15370 [Pseudooceanicola sp. CBS1P-1]|uniref:Uncharacterized protein n=1 Tax=Pseudooceanicola albus TaxID=2692189 RepID=A0A6L7G6F3_9RHOB|nr:MULTISPECIES: hypothetical protein [Pseudooceanicola]MBT9385251.1 hypothetical protein [Pseudooceanicola endophyticus]MXN18890.1 hypothetical protein [Pseudooceanicola albus]
MHRAVRSLPALIVAFPASALRHAARQGRDLAADASFVVTRFPRADLPLPMASGT